MSVILFIDMLGSRKKWQQGGVNEATTHFNAFSKMVVSASLLDFSKDIIRGGIETDSVTIEFVDAFSALKYARILFLWAFTRNIRNPLWLRGSLVNNSDEQYLRKANTIKKPLDCIEIFTYSKSTLDALSIEKSGFKGMRLLIREDVIDENLRKNLKINISGYSFIPLRKLNNSIYPDEEIGIFYDFLWMASNNDNDWFAYMVNMTKRLRYSAKDNEQFLQAAATQVVFDECLAIRQSLLSRNKRNKE